MGSAAGFQAWWLMRLSRGSEAPSQKPPEIPLEIKVGKAAVPAEALRSRVPIRAHPRRLRLAEVLAALAPRLELPAQDNRQEHRRTPVLLLLKAECMLPNRLCRASPPRWMKPRQRAAMAAGVEQPAAEHKGGKTPTIHTHGARRSSVPPGGKGDPCLYSLYRRLCPDRRGERRVLQGDAGPHCRTPGWDAPAARTPSYDQGDSKRPDRAGVTRRSAVTPGTAPWPVLNARRTPPALVKPCGSAAASAGPDSEDPDASWCRWR